MNKVTITLCFLVIFFGCESPNNKSTIDRKATLPSKTNIDTSLYIKEDLATTSGIRLGKAEFNKIVDSYPELHKDNPATPDETYYGRGRYLAKDKEPDLFGSEAGKDQYYLLYAYFLGEKIDKKYDGRRDTLINICNGINEIIGTLKGGGTFFGHQYARIHGYVEYDLYWYAKDIAQFSKPYDISGQRKLYISSLKLLVNDEVNNDNRNGLTGKDKKQKISGLLKIINYVEGLITDAFYLESAQEFQYSHYWGE